MKLFGLHVPGTRDKDREIDQLHRELAETRIQAQKDFDRVNNELLQAYGNLQDLHREFDFERSKRKGFSDRVEALQEQNRELTREAEVHRTAFNALAVMQGLGPDLSQERMLELARQAVQIEQASNRSCSLSYELYAVQICNEADRILPKLNEQEAKFFQAALGGDYTPPHERGQDWQSEHEIRQGLYREMYGDPDAYDDFAEDQEEEQEQERGVDDREEEPEQERQQGMDLSIGL